MASGGRAERGARPGRAASVVVPFPRPRALRPDPARLLPSGRSLLAAFGMLAVAAVSYAVARETAVFAVRSVEVDGAPPAVAQQVRRALRDELGTSLVRIDLARARERVAGLPTVAAAAFDRAFPHTLRVRVVPERPVAVLRQGADAWLVSARGRVMAALARGSHLELPRLWLPKGAPVALGGTAPVELAPMLQAVRPLARVGLGARVRSVRASAAELTLVLRGGLEIRLGDARDARLKLAVAARVLPLVPAGARYLDVSVPGRPVAGSVWTRPPAAPPAAAAAPTQDPRFSTRG